MTRFRLWALLAICAVRAFSANPPDVSFEIALPEGKTVWRMGERIPLKLRFSSSTPERWIAETRTQDRIGRLNDVDVFHVEPTTNARDPLEGLPGGAGGFGGISGGPRLLTAEPFELEEDLNEWVQFAKPGRYKLTVTTRRVFRRGSPRRSWPPEFEPTSNTITLQIVEASPAWAAEQLRAAIESLELEDSFFSYHDQERRDAARTLRFLGTREAAMEMVRRLGDEGTLSFQDLRFGVLTSPYREDMLPFMEERLTAPDQAVSPLFMRTLVELATSVREGPRPPAPPDGPERERWIEEGRAREERREATEARYYRELAASLPRKTGRAQSTGASTASRGAGPAGGDVVARTLRAGFLNLDWREQRDLLSDRWGEIAGPEVIPVLTALYRESPTRENRTIREYAVQRLYQLDPAAGRTVIVEDILDGRWEAGLDTQLMLTDEKLPEAYESFRERLTGWHGPYDLILRYADSSFVDAAAEAIDQRIAHMAEQNRPSCISPLHLYLLREAPDQGEALFRRDMAEAVEKQAPCLQFRVRGAYAWSPRLEEMLQQVPHNAPLGAQTSAVEMLGRWGSPAVEEYLWEKLEAYRQEWQGHPEEELRQDWPGLLGRQLRRALAKGTSWTLDTEGLGRLRNLCVDDECRRETDEWIRASNGPLEVSVRSSDPHSTVVQIGRYTLRSQEEWEAKADQLAGGGIFRWAPRPGPRADPQEVELRDWLEVRLPGLR